MSNKESSGTDPQFLAVRKYAALKEAVVSAGFFAPQIIGDEDGDRIVCNSKYQKGYGYTGRIIFVSEVGGDWYFATPHPYHYRVIDPERVEHAVVAFLGRDDDWQRHLVEISYQQYESALACGKKCR